MHPAAGWIGGINVATASGLKSKMASHGGLGTNGVTKRIQNKNWVICWVYPLPMMPVTNEGLSLGWDFLLKME